MQFYDFIVEHVCVNLDGLARKRLAITCKLLNDLVRERMHVIKVTRMHDISRFTSLNTLTLIGQKSVVVEFPSTLKIIRVCDMYCAFKGDRVDSMDRKTILPLCLEEFTTNGHVVPKIDHLLCLTKVELSCPFNSKSIIFPPNITILNLNNKYSYIDSNNVWNILPPNLVEFTIYCVRVNAGDINKLPRSLKKFAFYVCICNTEKDDCFNDGLVELKTNINIDDYFDVTKLPKSLKSISLAMTGGRDSSVLAGYLPRHITDLNVTVNYVDSLFYKNLPPLLTDLFIVIRGGPHPLHPNFLPRTLTNLGCNDYMLHVSGNVDEFPTSLVKMNGIVIHTRHDAIDLSYLTSLESLDIRSKSKIVYPPHIKDLNLRLMLSIPPESLISLACVETNLTISDLVRLPNLTELSINSLIYNAQADLVKFPPNLTYLDLQYNTLTAEQLNNLPSSLTSFTAHQPKHVDMRIVHTLYETKRVIFNN